MRYFKTWMFFAMLLTGIINDAHSQDNTLSAAEKKEGWKLLFNGVNTYGWRGAFLTAFPAKGWQVTGGCLMVEPSDGAESKNGGDIVTTKSYGSFELSVDFKITTGANSGIKYFVDPNQPSPADPHSAIGLEYQLLDDDVHPDAKLGKNGNRKLGSLYDLIPSSANKHVKPVGEWNTAKIVSKGNHVEHWLNGVKLFEYERGSKEFKDLVADSKYKSIPGFGLIGEGYILLQDHGNRAYFKNIKIKEIVAGSQGTNPAIVSYTFRNSFQKDVPRTLDRIKALGITNIEFSNLFGQTAAALRKMLDVRGMVCTSFGVTYPELVNATADVAYNARALGATYVRVAWVPHNDKLGFTIADAQKTAADFNKAGKMLYENGLTFCYHNHGYEFSKYKAGTIYDYLAANTDPRYVSFELDMLWAFYADVDPARLLKKYPTRYKLMHVKDLRKGIKGDSTGRTGVENDVALGTGQVNIPAAIQASRLTSVKYYYIEDESNDVATQVPVSLNYLKTLLKKQ